MKEIDVSRNRNVDDTVVTSLHNALTMANRRDDTKTKFDFEDDDACCEKPTPQVKVISSRIGQKQIVLEITDVHIRHEYHFSGRRTSE